MCVDGRLLATCLLLLCGESLGTRRVVSKDALMYMTACRKTTLCISKVFWCIITLGEDSSLLKC